MGKVQILSDYYCCMHGCQNPLEFTVRDIEVLKMLGNDSVVEGLAASGE
jgi:hypothetical protein